MNQIRITRNVNHKVSFKDVHQYALFKYYMRNSTIIEANRGGND